MTAVDLRLGKWQSVLADVSECDALITDPPYSARTHDGHFSGCTDDPDGSAARLGYDDKRSRRRHIGYTSWGDGDVRAFVGEWAPRVRGWFVAFTSHDLCASYSSALADAGRYVFAPLPFYEPGKCPRLTGDGPASWTCWIVVARPSTMAFASWGSLPGGYMLAKGVESVRDVVGGKPLTTMRQIVRDYTKPGDLIVDPCAGGGTTLLAAAIEGRRAIGSEMDPETFAKAKARLERGYTPEMFAT